MDKMKSAKFDWKEYFYPTKDRVQLFLIIAFLLFVIVFSFVIFGGGLSCPIKSLSLLNYAAIGILLLILGILFLPYVLVYGLSRFIPSLTRILQGYDTFFSSLLFILSIFNIYAVACILHNKVKNSRTLVFGTFCLSIFLLLMARPEIDCSLSNNPPLNQCLSQIASVPNCISNQGTWNSTGCGVEGCLISKHGLNEKCLSNTGPFNGTAWKKDKTHFNCGPNPA
jgi:hypothetical protein